MDMHGDIKMLFTGKAKHTVNKDGRVSIPSKMRDVMKKNYDPNDLYIVLMPGDVICLYPGESFEKLAMGWLANPEGSNLQDVMEIERLCAEAEPCKLDGSGRIVVPEDMRDAAGIEQEVLVAGSLTHIEIWNPQFWERDRKTRGGLDKYRTFPVQSGVAQ